MRLPDPTHKLKKVGGHGKGSEDQGERDCRKQKKKEEPNIRSGSP